MKTKTLIIFLSALCVIIVSCKKSNSSSSQGNTITGNWYFVSEKVNTQSVVEQNSGGTDVKDVTTFNYVTTYDSGTVNITSSTMAFSGLTYYISGTAFDTTYENNVLTDTASTPVSYYVAPSSSSSSYTMVGTDSVYFPAGGFGTPPGTTAGAAYGAKIAFLADTAMTLTSNFSKDSTGYLYGMPATFTSRATMVTTLHR
ncbi:MAG: hypothetical protein JST87_07615 [Bacteroidetes bacterium]|nr:hypothetical protein [Bacteroidota bacterium]